MVGEVANSANPDSRADVSCRSFPPYACCVGNEVPAGLLAKLHEAAADRMSSVNAPKSRDTLNTALRSFARFVMQCPERVLFREKGDISERQAATCNEWIFILYAMWLAGRPSKQTKHPVRARTTESYISLIKQGLLAI